MHLILKIGGIRFVTSNEKSEYFRMLAESHMKTLYNYILKKLPSREDASDIMQETMASVWGEIIKNDSFAVSSEKEKTWLIGIAKHKIADFYRDRYKNQTSDIDEIVFSLEDSESERQFEITEIQADVKSAVAQLSADDRELIYLTYASELRYPEVSEIMGIPVGTVKSRMSAIKMRLKNILEKEGYGYE